MTNMTIEEFRRIFADWQNSGLTIRRYCCNTGMHESRFYYWKKRLTPAVQSPGHGNFIPVRVSGNPSGSPTSTVSSGPALCEVAYPNGVVVRVTSDMTLEQLRQMITLLS